RPIQLLIFQTNSGRTAPGALASSSGLLACERHQATFSIFPNLRLKSRTASAASVTLTVVDSMATNPPGLQEIVRAHLTSARCPGLAGLDHGRGSRAHFRSEGW